MKALSASQIELHRRCARRWAFRYRTNLPKPPPTAQNALGTAVHAIAEAYNKTGVVAPDKTEALELFRKGLPYMPFPGKGTPEYRFERTIGDIPYMGFMDWRGDSEDIPGEGRVGAPAVLDYKTSSDPEKYGFKGPSDFLTNVQPLLYLQTALEENSHDTARAHWVYFKTKGKPKAYAVSALLPRAQVEDAFDRVVHSAAKKIVSLRVLDPNELEPNRDACFDYRVRCEYADHCKPDAEEIYDMTEPNLLSQLQALMEDDTSSTLEIPTGEMPRPPAINRPKRVSSRPPTEEKVIVVAVDPGTVKKTEKTVQEVLADVKMPIKTDGFIGPASTGPVNPIKVILEELGEALIRASKRVG